MKLDFKIPLVLFFVLLFSKNIYCQTATITLLKQNIQQSKNDVEKLSSTLLLCEQGYNLHGDTLMHYATNALELAKKNNNLSAEVTAKYFIAYALTNNGLVDSSLQIADDCLKNLEKDISDPVLVAKIYNQKGRCFMRKNQYKEAIEMGYKVISGGEKTKDTLLQMQGKTLIGWANLEMNKIYESLRWHLAAMRTTTNETLLGKYSILFANIALNYNARGFTDSAFYYIEKAVLYSRKYENLFALSNSLAIQAQFFVRQGNSKKAATLLEEVVAIRNLIGDPFYSVSDMGQLSIYYANNKQYEKGIAIALEGIAIARNYNIGTKLSFLYSALAENYKAMGNNNLYATTLEKIINIKDSVYLNNSAQALAEMQTKYELQKKENTIIQQKLNITQKNYLFYSALLLSLLTAIAGFALFKSYKKRQQLKTEKILANQKYKASLDIKEAEENERKRIAADLHDNLGVYAASMASNLDYIEMQDKNIKSNDTYLELKKNSQSIIRQLNDTIWVLKRDALSLTAISDRVKLFIHNLQPSYPQFNILVTEKINTDFLVSSSQAFHLFRIIQESIINALKHSNGNQIEIKILTEKYWTVEIIDNGNGMVSNLKNTKDGNGISNIKNRCKECDWKIIWETKSNGTNVKVWPTTN